MKQYQYLFKEAGVGTLVGSLAGKAVNTAKGVAGGLRGAANQVRTGLQMGRQDAREAYRAAAAGRSRASVAGDAAANARADAVTGRMQQRADIGAMGASNPRADYVNKLRASGMQPASAQALQKTRAANAPAAPGMFAQHSQNIQDLWNAGRQGGWSGLKTEFMKNPARNAAYAGAGLYGAGTAKDYFDAATGSDEYDYNLWDKIKMGIGMEQKPSAFDPMLPFFMRGYHAN